MSSARLAVCGLAALGAAVAFACTERLPISLEPEDAGPPPPAWGLDARPIAPTCAARAKGPSRARVSFEPVSPVKFDRPVAIETRGSRMYVLEQGGLIRVLGADTSVAPTVADLTKRAGGLRSGGEAGLLGIAFHPDFAQNKLVYLYFTADKVPAVPGIAFEAIIARYESPDGGLTLNLATEKRILTIDDPFGNHNGGTIQFGNDGYLYFGLGDAGGGGDPLKAGQDPNQLFGKMIRLDVDGGDPYAIPPNNPFAAGGGRPEIYALGFRNPYRWSFDRPTGDLWVGDVGQGTREEIDKVILGGNYGWSIREGKTCFEAPTCDATGLIDPVVDHERTPANLEAISICGGVVYRGSKIPEISGKYVYGDTGTGRFWAIPTDEAAPTPLRLEQDLPKTSPVGFALDPNGEVVFANYEGTILRIAPPKPPQEMPDKLSETGCMDPADATKPIAGLFPYDVNVPQWADGALAERYLSIPGDAKIGVLPDGRLELPAGSVAMKLVRAEGRPVETQLLLRRPDGAWEAYAYAWDDDGRDATLVGGSKDVKLRSGRDHHIVDRAGCASCHNAAAGVTLGVEAAQIDRDFAYPARTGNPLATLEHVGMLSSPVARESYRALPRLEGYDTLDRRARAYLHGNCASCHRGSEPPALDLRFSTRLDATRACDTPRLVLGKPEASSIVETMRASGPGRMPPIATTVVHEAAATTVADWIRSLSRCE
ncbi:MAG: PQQ-dependent sugar dehydrogenase [Labilithrix sp.]|nr:PQQ-dependent sugar dehydrogenase [Labilithrix sp.]